MKSEQIQDLLERGVEEIIDRNELEKKLLGRNKLRIKLGIDPTSPHIHIGRAAVLWKLKAFQDLGHQVVFIIGDFTGTIGDTSDKDSERPMLSAQVVKHNLKTYFQQAFKILDKSKTETEYNSKWLKKMGFTEIAQLADLFSLHEFEARENIAKRLQTGKRISLRELLYPLMQGYDSVAVEADVELGGTDQRFNLLAGRTIQSAYNQEPQNIMTLTLLEGVDGRKMSSSWGNVINLTDEPNEMFGKVMSIPDGLMIKYFTLATQVSSNEIQQLTKKAVSDPRNTKIRLATEIVTLYYGYDMAVKAAREFEQVFTQKRQPDLIPEIKVKAKDLVSILVEVKFAASRTEAKRLIAQNGVKVNNNKATEELEVPSGSIIQVGKRKFAKIVQDERV